ncbi:hypothetical protein KUCAC02_025436, partial [Chaenocephalus aceratus]
FLNITLFYGFLKLNISHRFPSCGLFLFHSDRDFLIIFRLCVRVNFLFCLL